MQVSAEELRKNHVPLAYRDVCAHLLIPLNKCREQTRFMPWKCEDERHTYEKCQYELYVHIRITLLFVLLVFVHQISNL